ncbi:hypothetical protein scyTo_0009954 [Scyliorhinus torazame]|uniref:Dedicator of cytokinesis C/D N-terminal domain-containing protein n=1 Tax=Scyliorhinus torazame TaxID=75743 RepID=A0A401NX03_SCYTO|nr:hypothetical protein [Scyliorhinus torazame]
MGDSARRFTRGLFKPGTAAEIRQSAAVAVKRPSLLAQEKPKIVEPLDYEAVIEESESQIQDHLLKDMLLFPDNDFSTSSIPRERRTVCSTVPEGAENEAEHLLVKQEMMVVEQEIEFEVMVNCEEKILKNDLGIVNAFA